MQMAQNCIQWQTSCEAQSVFLKFHLDETANRLQRLNVAILVAGKFLLPHVAVLSPLICIPGSDVNKTQIFLQAISLSILFYSPLPL
jgi:hypothetical protein